MAGICVEKIGSIQVFKKEDGTYDAYDFANGVYIPDPYKDKPKGYKPVAIKKTKEQIDAEIEEIKEYGCTDLPERKLRKDSLEYFSIKIGVSEADGKTPEVHYYPYLKDGELVAYKVRLIEGKRMWSLGGMKDVDLFGWDKAIGVGGKKLFITEGEIDAVSLYQIFKDHNRGTQYADFSPAVVSLTNGASSAPAAIARNLKSIREHFKEIVLVFDMDEAGRKAAEDVVKIVPDAIVAHLPAKDVNECLMTGRSKACYNAIQFNAKKLKNSRIVLGNDLHEAAKQPPVYGFAWPWKHVTEATRGIRLGETIYLGAGQKQGKSEIVNTLAAHFMKEFGWKVFMAKPEESNKKTYKLVAGKLMGKFFHDPRKEFDEEAYEQAGRQVVRDLP